VIARATATRSSRGVVLSWFAADSSADTVTIERRSNRVGEWQSIGRAFADGDSRLAFEDRSVLAGYHYDYRLGLPVNQRQIYRGEVSIDVPPIPRLILYGAWPNPSAQSVHLVFNLPAAGVATIEVLDLSGRRIVSRSQAWTAGWNQMDLAGIAELRPGVYAVRLIHGGEIATAKVIRLR